MSEGADVGVRWDGGVALGRCPNIEEPFDGSDVGGGGGWGPLESCEKLVECVFLARIVAVRRRLLAESLYVFVLNNKFIFRYIFVLCVNSIFGGY